MKLASCPECSLKLAAIHGFIDLVSTRAFSDAAAQIPRKVSVPDRMFLSVLAEHLIENFCLKFNRLSGSVSLAYLFGCTAILSGRPVACGAAACLGNAIQTDLAKLEASRWHRARHERRGFIYSGEMDWHDVLFLDSDKATAAEIDKIRDTYLVISLTFHWS